MHKVEINQHECTQLTGVGLCKTWSQNFENNKPVADSLQRMDLSHWILTALRHQHSVLQSCNYGVSCPSVNLLKLGRSASSI
jgi:hypothetical protein